MAFNLFALDFLLPFIGVVLIISGALMGVSHESQSYARNLEQRFPNQFHKIQQSSHHTWGSIDRNFGCFDLHWRRRYRGNYAQSTAPLDYATQDFGWDRYHPCNTHCLACRSWVSVFWVCGLAGAPKLISRLHSWVLAWLLSDRAP
jgi:hypothetical protein